VLLLPTDDIPQDRLYRLLVADEIVIDDEDDPQARRQIAIELGENLPARF
jgi:hypothetical protein